MYTIAPRRDSVPGGHASPECLLTCHVQVSVAPDPDALFSPLCCLSHDLLCFSRYYSTYGWQCRSHISEAVRYTGILVDGGAGDHNLDVLA